MKLEMEESTERGRVSEGEKYEGESGNTKRSESATPSKVTH